MTCQRSIILEELKKSRIHPTASQVYELVRKRMPQVSLATVYRNLEKLTQAGMVQTVELAGCPRRYDGRVGEHVHVRCVDCGRVEDISGGVLDLAAERVGRRRGYKILDHHLEFTGRCPECEKRESKEKQKGERRKGNAES
jgi:Fur family ferric uptake transcriptional regulator